jgi:hypothetical protein
MVARDASALIAAVTVTGRSPSAARTSRIWTGFSSSIVVSARARDRSRPGCPHGPTARVLSFSVSHHERYSQHHTDRVTFATIAGAHRQGPQWGYVLSPLAAPHHRREGLVFRGPSVKGKRSWPSPDGGRGKRSLTYERSSAASAVSAPLSRTSALPRCCFDEESRSAPSGIAAIEPPQDQPCQSSGDPRPLSLGERQSALLAGGRVRASQQAACAARTDGCLALGAATRRRG